MRTVWAVVALMLVAACGSSAEPSVKPTFGVSETPSPDSDDLEAARAAARIEECPAFSGTSELPRLTLDCLGGGSQVTLARMEGPAVINLWASYCAPCLTELPLLARAHRELADVQFLGIIVADAAPGAAIDLASSTGVTYPQVVDRDRVTFGPIHYQGLPATVFVAPDGSFTTINSAFDSYDDLTEAIETNLGVTR